MSDALQPTGSADSRGTQIRCLIVDDEPYARGKICKFLEDQGDVFIIGECGNGPEALRAIRCQNPDLVFLDIQMPDMNGFRVLKELAPPEMPLIIFVTAFNEFAIDAFRVRALDYLLKPYSKDRFMAALERARETLKQGDSDSRYGDILELLHQLNTRSILPEEPSFWERFVLKKGNRAFFIKTNDVQWIKAAGKQVELHLQGRKEILGKTLTEIERNLNPKHFMRVHRSLMVNLDRIDEIQNWFWGEYLLLMSDGSKLRTGRSYKAKIAQLLNP